MWDPMQLLPEGYNIRAAGLEDIARMIAADIAASELFRPTGLIYDMAPVPDGVPTQFLRDAIRENMVIAADFEGIAIGFCLMSIRGEADFYIDQLSVDPAHGRKGIGAALVTACLQYSESLGHKEVFLSTFRHLEWNGPFYKKLGFKELPRRKLTDWMIEIENAQREEMDVSKRCFMVRKVRRWQR